MLVSELENSAEKIINTMRVIKSAMSGISFKTVPNIYKGILL
jgi:hypothetical protein